MSEELLYVYAVLRTGPQLPRSLVEADTGPVLGAGLRLVGHDGLTAVAEPVSAADFDEGPLRARLEDLDWLAKVARAHHGVVARVGRLATTVPLRLATVCRGPEGVRRMLAEGREPLTRALRRLEGTEEWGVKLYTEPAAADGPPASPAPSAAGGSGRDYLRTRVAARRARDDRDDRARQTARTLHDDLRARASGAVTHPPQHSALSSAPGRNVLNAAYLVPTAHRRAFLDGVPDADSLPAGLRIEVTGPWVPYSFAHGPADAAEAP
ncbi:GvpL/GvpF family gas vesicle protein [Streptomyces sp. WAC07061]|uniref:GvpL/GvpF family gas vesicle protein n=1 Tax=Streptomyces sp. WAC07061 TaxID=2487410 RepID=UPI000F77B481|nr:GvpL/GvpF family gas vesicle protein [Streptomyces sp. WAC07061]RSS57950.1 GvpL/GvpF family gas vesicle protein [Streptomyces sp. WAC07061]